MSRLNRKNRTVQELGNKEMGHLIDIFDNELKSVFRINDQEYDFIAERITDEEMDVLLKEYLTYPEKRTVITILNKYLTEFENLPSPHNTKER